ncbi:Modification methylase HaeIII [Streptomyces netropsis]|nr:Modification methylase HaeIII [Streptomyces netropsis]
MGLGNNSLTSLEICAGAGGQALGIEQAGFTHVGLVERNSDACETLRQNRPQWQVFEEDLRKFDPGVIAKCSVDLLAGGVPCTPYSIAGKQLGATDGRDLLPEALRLVAAIVPRAVMIENVAALAQNSSYGPIRDSLISELKKLGYKTNIFVLDAQDFGLAQRRKRALIVALRDDTAQPFRWPMQLGLAPTVGEVLGPSMASAGWGGANEWSHLADDVAPTLVGGSEKHGGGDLGPARAKRAWARLAVNGNSYADDVPDHNFVLRHGQGNNGWEGYPRLTLAQASLLQGFPPDWRFSGSKTARSKQIGNAFPPPVARAVAECIAEALGVTHVHDPA